MKRSESAVTSQAGAGRAVPQRRRARRGEGELLRERIIEAAGKLLVESGGDEEAVSIRDVADAVGVTPPSIYLHFADKTELIFAVSERNFRLFDRFLEEAAAKGKDPVEALELRCRAYVRFGVEHPGPYRILFMSKPGATPRNWSLENILADGAFMHLVQNVRACMEAGAMETEDPVLVATLLWAAVHGITSLLVTGKELPAGDVDAIVGKLRQVLLRGLEPKT